MKQLLSHFATRAAIMLALQLPLLLFGFSVTNSYAQRTADPNAIELRPYIRVLDSADAQTSIYVPSVLGDVNGDGIDDILTTTLMTDDTGRATQVRTICLMSTTGLTKQDTISLNNPVLIADIDGDGRKDIIDYQYVTSAYYYFIHRGIPRRPYFDTAEQLMIPTDFRPTVVADVNGDNIPDLIANEGRAIYIFRGPIVTNRPLVPIDSIHFQGATSDYRYLVHTFVGEFTPEHKKQILLITSKNEEAGEWLWSITAQLYPTDISSAAPTTIFTDSANAPVFVYTRPAAVADVTGDELDDFIMSDTAHVYIFAGGPNFGSKTFSHSDADLVLTAPHLISSSELRSDFPQEITPVGDITGSGIPYLAVSASVYPPSTSFARTWFYAMGSARDPYYDATLTSTNYAQSDVTPIRFGSSNGLVFIEQIAPGTQIDMLKNGLENIPHSQQSSVALIKGTEGLSMIASGSGAVILTLPDHSTQITVYNSLGAVIEAHEVRGTAYTLNCTNWAHGAYSIVINASHSYRAKFIW
jgi:hypothetical protein